MSLLTTKPRKRRRLNDPTVLHLALGLMLGGAIVAIVFWAAL